MPPFVWLKGNVHGSSVAGLKARSRLPISALNFFRQLSRLRRYERILVESVVFKGVGHFERKF